MDAEPRDPPPKKYLPRPALILPGAPAPLAGAAEPPELEGDAGLVGQTLGSFRLLRRIGKGRMSTVYAAGHLAIGSQVALKLLHPHLAADPWVVARFYSEARALSLAAHENIVSVFDTGSAGPERHYLIMELLEGRPLSALAAAGPLPAEAAVLVLTQLCDALEAGHRRGLVHRSLRPQNIFVIRRGGTEHFVKLLDFGTAALSPMQAARPPATPADGRADVHALGGIARLLLAGRGGTPPRRMVPAALLQAVERALAERLEERFRTAEDFKAALLAGLQGEIASNAPTAPRPRPELPAPEAPAPEARAASQATEEPETPTQPISPPIELRGAFRDAAGRELGVLRCIEVTRGGLFACTEDAPPPLLSRLSLSLLAGGRELSCAVEVVRHVDAAQARAWGMPPGFGAQFVEPSPAFRDALAFKDALGRLLEGESLGEPAPAARDDAEAGPLLAAILGRSATDPYAFLSLPRDAPMAEVRQRAREERQRLEALRARPLSSEQLLRVESALQRLGQAVSLLSQPARRAELDARLGNFQGVARCVAAGLSAAELEACRQRYLAGNPAAETRSLVHALTARSFREQGELEKALAQYEGALAQDPLNLELHREYWSLKHRAGQGRGTPAGR